MASVYTKHEAKLKELLAGARLFGDPVPTQRHDDTRPPSPTPPFGGELRGFYPTLPNKDKEDLTDQDRLTAVATGTWFPLNSEKHGKHGGGHRRHGGVDIYAPYTPYPYEIPVLALADGTLQFSYWHFSTNSIGSQANLYLTDKAFGDYRYRLIYGHLSRFSPVNDVTWKTKDKIPVGTYRNPVSSIAVKKGDVIGYIGASGNVDTLGEARTRISPAGVASGHIHLQLSQTVPPSTPKKEKGKTAKTKQTKGKKRTLDPRPILPFPIDDVSDIADPDKPAVRAPASKWKTLNKGREAYGEVFYEGTDLKMAPGGNRLTDLTLPAKKRAAPMKPNIAPWPFHGLNLDQYGLLTDTRAAYRKIKYGLRGSIGPYTTIVLKTQSKALALIEAAEMAKRVGATLQDLHARARMAADTSQTTSSDRAARVTAALLHLIEGQYTLLGGPGFEAPGTQAKKYAGKIVVSGVGVQGRLFGVASVGKREATTNATPNLSIGYVHETWKEIKGRDRPEYAALSVGFGSGSPREATLNMATIAALKSEADGATEETTKKTLQAMHDYCMEVLFAHLKLTQTISFAARNRERLTGTGTQSDAAWTAFCDRVDAVAGEQRTAADIYIDDKDGAEKRGVTDKARQRLWYRMAVDNLAIIGEILKYARKPSKEVTPAMPELRLLFSETPPPSPGGGQ